MDLVKRVNASGVVKVEDKSVPVSVPPVDGKARKRFFQRKRLAEQLDNIKHDTAIKKLSTDIIHAKVENQGVTTDGKIALRQAQTMQKVDDARLSVASAECKAIEAGLNEKLKRLSFGG